MSPSLDISHGRGGAGNINPDDTQYTDGEVVRVADGPGGSSGRGGAGNISDSPAAMRVERDVVPSAATRHMSQGAVVGGRGGLGNLEHGLAVEAHGEGEGGTGKRETGEEEGGEGGGLVQTEATPVGLADKLKGKIFELLRK